MRRFEWIYVSAIILALLVLPVRTAEGQHPDHHARPQAGKEHHGGVNERGDKAMGFSHKTTTHHFILLKEGGVIEVAANDARDGKSRDQIREHLAHIAVMFAEGNFSLPMFIHDQNPPGVDVMKEKKEAITYKYEESEAGARVRLTTADKKALAAIHEFLRFQIKDHQTGDSLEITRN
jgi:hypothetical protein